MEKKKSKYRQWNIKLPDCIDMLDTLKRCHTDVCYYRISGNSTLSMAAANPWHFIFQGLSLGQAIASLEDEIQKLQNAKQKYIVIPEHHHNTAQPSFRLHGVYLVDIIDEEMTFGEDNLLARFSTRDEAINFINRIKSGELTKHGYEENYECEI